MLLKRLRDTMARADSVDGMLGEVVRLVASELVAEVCSIYLLRAGEVLELFATQGLNPIGGPSHPAAGRRGLGRRHCGACAAAGARRRAEPSAVRLSSGDRRGTYHSLAGVPILRMGRVLGVLVVQNRTRRQYDEEEIETLQTIAMVLAELISAGHFVSPNEVSRSMGSGCFPCASTASAHARHRHRPRGAARAAHRHPEGGGRRRRPGADAFETAAHGVREDIDRMLEAHDMQSGEQREILETFRMFVDDRGWLERVREAVASGLTAEAAVQRAFDDVRARLGQSADPYIRERLSDLQDLTNRLLLRLSGRVAPDPSSLPDDMIVIARDMGPAELLDYDRTRLRGLVLEEGSA